MAPIMMRAPLFMPASNARALEKAKSLPADAVILDLEDAVGPQDKADARAKAVAAVRSGDYGPRQLLVRINAAGTPWHADDIEALAGLTFAGLVLPKVERVGQLVALYHRILALRIEAPLFAMIETAIGVRDVAAIAAAPVPLAGLIAGTNDLALDLGATALPGRANFIPFLSLIVLAAKAQQLLALDGVYNDFRDTDGLRSEAEQARAMGFDGKTVIHPAQLEACNMAFGVSEAEVEKARALVEAYENAGGGVAVFEGRMIEELHVRGAKRLLARAASIARIEGAQD